MAAGDDPTAAFATCSRDYRYLSVSRSYAELICRPAEEIVGHSIDTILGRQAFDALLPRLRTALSGTTVEFDQRLEISGHSPRWYHAVYTPAFDLEGNVEGFVARVNEVDEPRPAPAIRSDSERRSDELLAVVAHELRNPMASIRSGIDLLTANGVRDEALDIMRDQVEQAVRMVDDLLDASRLEQKGITLHTAPLELRSLVQKALDSARPLFAARQHVVHFAAAEEIWIDGDASRLSQVVINLLQNAAKFTNPGGRIDLELAVEADQAILTVKDTGIGIAPELMPRIFDLFTQGDRALERSQGGLGIGLSLVRSIVALHGGRVTAASAGINQGTEFAVALPRRQTPVTETEAESAATASGRSFQILVAEDNLGSATILSRLLGKLGTHEVLLAHDGPSALEAAMTHRPDIVLCDLGLPLRSGLEVGRQLRSEREFDETLLVALTGYAEEEDRRRTTEAGFDVHLVKPVSLQVLQGLLGHPKLTPSRH